MLEIIVKMKSNIQFGIAPYVTEILIEHVKGQSFSFKFDDTTTSQVEKYYDTYVQYYTKVLKLILPHTVSLYL